MSQPTLARVRKQYVKEGLEAILNRRAPRKVYHRVLDGEQEARLIAVSCGEPPKGQAQGGVANRFLFKVRRAFP